MEIGLGAFKNFAVCKQGCQPLYRTCILKLLIKVDNRCDIFKCTNKFIKNAVAICDRIKII